MNTKIVRNSNIEILRFILMAFILIWHILVHGYNLKEIGYLKISEENIILKIFLLVIASPAVNCFMFMSGFFGIKFSSKRLMNFILMGYFCFILINLYLYYNNLFSFNKFAKNIFPFASGYWWFFTLYLIIFILSPIFDTYFKYTHQKKIRLLLILFGLFNVLHLSNLLLNSGSNLTNLLFMYLLGKYFYNYPLSLKRKHWLIIFLVSLLFLFSLQLILYYNNYSKFIFILLGYDNILIIILAISIFHIVYLSKPIYSNTINKLLTPVFFIYLLTEGIGIKLYKFLANTLDQNLLLSFIYIFVTLIISILIGHTYNFLYTNIIEKYLINKKHVITKKIS